MNTIVRAAAACAALCSVVATAGAATLFDTYSSYQSGPQVGWGWTESRVGGQAVSSLVALTQRSALGSIDWIGGALPKGGGFVLCVYSDAGAGPAKLLAERVLLARRTALTRFDGQIVEERYTASISLGTSLPAARYWLTILGNVPSGLNYGVSSVWEEISGFGGAGFDPAIGWAPLTTTNYYTSRGAAIRVKGSTSTSGSGVPVVNATGKCPAGSPQ